ncbi:unnamed protein product [Acanthoscelides obtectus]|uniref:Uncharacterized protein n=1 Tax=Acanthoscelides obtectus TaxID=200917 RepID=A0A9P0KVQ0_ACAOB|nr:unnamed protein product [Acanthoscelides obtectus]CAK1681914.1 hypothetical protein AOBTE_LOCUS33330 [Acanthoscelides obtectus]
MLKPRVKLPLSHYVHSWACINMKKLAASCVRLLSHIAKLL